MQGHFFFVFSFCAFNFVNVRCWEAFRLFVPEIVSNITWKDTVTLSAGDMLSYNMCIYHTSSSHIVFTTAYNVRLRWMFSSNLKFQTLNQTEGRKISVHVYSSYVDVEVKKLYGKENVCCNLTFVFDPHESLSPGRHFVTSHTQLSWDRRVLLRSQRYINHWETLSHSTEVPGCSKELGITSGYIKDHQISSSSFVVGHEPFNARLNNSQGWCAAVLDDAQFLQIDFVHEVKITKLLVRGVNSDVGVEQYILEYSLDQTKWRNYTEYGMTKTFNHPLNGDSSSVNWLTKPFKTYNVRLRPTRWNASICLKLELYGCENLETPASCILPLGMESGFIPDEALSTGVNHGNPHDSRLGLKVNSPGGWLASPYVSEDYFQIDLSVLYLLTKIAVEGQWSDTGRAESFVRHYTVKVSNDSLLWQDYMENGKVKIFDGPTSSLAAIYPTFVKLAEPVVTRYVRILPQEQPGYRVMRLEIYGCLMEPRPSYPGSERTLTFRISLNTLPTLATLVRVPNDFSRRSYILNNLTGDFYVCLYSDDRTKSSCQYTRDGYNWKKLSERIVKVLAVGIDDDKMYILDRSNSFQRHSAGGWTVISPEQWGRVKVSSNVILARDVPDNLFRKSEIDGEIFEFNDGHQWTVSHAGVHMKNPGGNWSLVAKWK